MFRIRCQDNVAVIVRKTSLALATCLLILDCIIVTINVTLASKNMNNLFQCIHTVDTFIKSSLTLNIGDHYFILFSVIDAKLVLLL